eukprot:g17224.t1
MESGYGGSIQSPSTLVWPFQRLLHLLITHSRSDIKSFLNHATQLVMSDCILGQVAKEMNSLLPPDHLRTAIHGMLQQEVFDGVYSVLFPIYVARHMEQQLMLAARLKMFAGVTLHGLRLGPQLCGFEKKGGKSSPMDSGYAQAFQQIQRLQILKNPGDKLACISQVALAICACVDSFAGNKAVVVDADDLLLLFAYILIHAKIEDIHAHVRITEDYMQDQERFLMSGYYLMTCVAAVELILTQDLLPQDQTSSSSPSSPSSSSSSPSPNPTSSPSPSSSSSSSSSSSDPVSSDSFTSAHSPSVSVASASTLLSASVSSSFSGDLPSSADPSFTQDNAPPLRAFQKENEVNRNGNETDRVKRSPPKRGGSTGNVMKEPRQLSLQYGKSARVSSLADTEDDASFGHGVGGTQAGPAASQETTLMEDVQVKFSNQQRLIVFFSINTSATIILKILVSFERL